MIALQGLHVKSLTLEGIRASAFRPACRLRMISTLNFTELERVSISTRREVTSRSDTGASRTLTANQNAVLKLVHASMTKNVRVLTSSTTSFYQNAASEFTHKEKETINSHLPANHRARRMPSRSLEIREMTQQRRIKCLEGHGTIIICNNEHLSLACSTFSTSNHGVLGFWGFGVMVQNMF